MADDVISHYSSASSIASLREADEVRTFPLLDMPAPAVSMHRSKSPPRGIKEVLLNKQKREKAAAAAASIDAGSTGGVGRSAMHGGSGMKNGINHPTNNNYREGFDSRHDSVLPGVLKTMRPPVGHSRPDDPASKRAAASMWQSTPNYAGLKLDGGSHGLTLPLAPTPVHAFLSKIERNQTSLSVVNLGGPSTTTRSTRREPQFDPGMEELRNYTVLMDKFGLNQFMIYRGATLTSTPEFEAFRSKYNHDWGAITGVIRDLEDFLRAREVKLAIINGPRLHEIASLNLPTVHRDDLLSCISNIEEIKSSTTTGKRVSVEKERGAATCIQARARAFLGRRRYLRDKRRAVNAIVIQSVVRRMIAQRVVRERMRLSRSKYEDQWGANVERLKSSWGLMSHWGQPGQHRAGSDGHGAPGWGDDAPSSSSVNPHPSLTQLPQQTQQQQQRLVVMIPSISAAEYVRLSLDRIHTIQNMHIACLYQLADPRVHVVYVSPVHLTTDEAAYHERFLEALGIHMPPTQAKRLHFVVPELLRRLPAHTPLAQVLWYSTAALRKVKGFLRRFPHAIIVPTTMSWAERRLSNLFNTPMLSPDPVAADTIRSRSFLKKIFAEACVNVPVGAHDIASTSDFYLALSRLIASNLEVRRWVFRLNVDFNCEGCAYLDVDRLTVMAGLRKEMLTLLSMGNHMANMGGGSGHGVGHGGGHGGESAGAGHDGTGTPGVTGATGGAGLAVGGVGAWYNKAVQLDVRKRVMQCLRAEMGAKAVVCRRDLHGGWEQFERYFKMYGMVIEAEPLNLIGAVQGLCFVDPTDGHVQVSHGVDVMVDDRYQAQAYIGPQSRVPKAALRGATRAIAEQLYRSWGVVGYVTVEYQAYWDTLDDTPRVNAMGVQFGLTPVFGGLGSAAVASGAVAGAGAGSSGGTGTGSATGYDNTSGVGADGAGSGPSAPLPPSLLPRDDSQSLGGKFFVHIPYAYHQPLQSSRDDAFLKFCRMKGITFDPEAHIGTLFFHVDSVVSGALSALSLGSTRRRAVETSIQAMSFVMDQYGRDREVREATERPTWDSLSTILHNMKTLYKRDYKKTTNNSNGGQVASKSGAKSSLQTPQNRSSDNLLALG